MNEDEDTDLTGVCSGDEVIGDLDQSCLSTMVCSVC